MCVPERAVEAATHLTQDRQVQLAIRVVEEDRLAAIPARGDVVERAGEL